MIMKPIFEAVENLDVNNQIQIEQLNLFFSTVDHIEKLWFMTEYVKYIKEKYTDQAEIAKKLINLCKFKFV